MLFFVYDKFFAAGSGITQTTSFWLLDHTVPNTLLLNSCADGDSTGEKGLQHALLLCQVHGSHELGRLGRTASRKSLVYKLFLNAYLQVWTTPVKQFATITSKSISYRYIIQQIELCIYQLSQSLTLQYTGKKNHLITSFN